MSGQGHPLVPTITYIVGKELRRIILPADVIQMSDPRFTDAVAQARAGGTKISLEMMRGASVLYRRAI